MIFHARRGLFSCLVLTIISSFAGIALAGKPGEKSAKHEIDFNRDIRSILSDKCFRCHGPDSGSREAELRLDREEDAKAARDGNPAIVPGKLDESALIARITSTDDGERMPPPDSGKELKPAEIALLKRWVAEGAVWSLPWAYVPPKPHTPPKVQNGSWPLNWIDNYVLSRLEAEGVSPATEADKTTLIRRLSIDLIGLPPTPQEVEQFLADTRPDAYEKLIDRLMASPHYGERMAMYWLDLVRYADTVGYHGDQEHAISPYRDYVIDAFNRNLPFDQFTREQLAGDLLKEPTREQTIATGYNRVLQTSHEGGVQPKEYLAIYAADRIRNLSNVWMGGTMGCAQCHDHKFDPYTSKDFYSMQAFFADIDEAQHFHDGTNDLRTYRRPELEMPTEEQKKEIDELESQVAKLQKKIKKELPKASPEVVQSFSKKKKGADETNDAPPSKSDANAVSPRTDEALSAAVAETSIVENQRRKDQAAQDELVKRLQMDLASAKAKLKSVHDQTRASMITVSIKPRTIRVLPRGNWLDDSGEIVEPAIPAFLGKLDVGDRRPTRLDLADWLTDSSKGTGGFTARVMANRFWYLLFGRGISPTLDDFGGQGEAPSHPELLDALALEFVKSGWDVKHMVKLIAMSRAYRQSSQEPDELRERDPLNSFFAHQAKYRFPAEVVRDSALEIGGLLVETVDGDSVRPYQPAGYYRHLNFPEREYVSDKDDRQWRRGVYMHWQRTYLHPMLKAFDAPTREECTAQRCRSNTPLAALVLLNDPTFVEASRSLAGRILHEGGNSLGEQLDFVCRLAYSRPPRDAEQQVLSKLLDESRQYYVDKPAEAEKLLKVGMKPVPEGISKTDLAAWTVVARTILATSEAITRE